MNKDKSQNFTKISLVVPELELFLARKLGFHEMQKVVESYIWLDFKAKNCQNYIYYFTLKTPQKQTSLAICQSRCCCCLPRPIESHREQHF